MDHRAYWVWLQHAFGEGSPLPCQLDRRFLGGVEEFYKGGPRLWNTLTFISERQAATLYSFSLEEAEARLEYVEKAGWSVLTPGCREYPGPLRNIPDPPAVLYAKGQLPDLENHPAIAITGARKALGASVQAAKSFGYQLAAGGLSVVSGGAVGIDSAALEGAMSASGQVVSVLPVDLDSPYVHKNAGLRREICQRGGALLSEYFSQRNPAMGGFQVRNRLITGLSCGVVLIQAAAKSGTVMYARFAIDQNRDVFVYPGPAGAPEYAGSQALLADGAKAVTCGEEVLEEYAPRFGRRARERAVLPQEYVGLFDEVPFPEEAALADPGAKEPGLSAEGEKIWAALGQGPLGVAQLAEKTGLGAGQLLGLLTELELEGVVASAPGKRYRRAR